MTISFWPFRRKAMDTGTKKVEQVANVNVQGTQPQGRGITQAQIDNWFTYHAPTADDQVGYVAIRVAAKALAETIVKHSPTSADQSAAIRLLRDAVMTANASIACKGQ